MVCLKPAHVISNNHAFRFSYILNFYLRISKYAFRAREKHVYIGTQMLSGLLETL